MNDKMIFKGCFSILALTLLVCTLQAQAWYFGTGSETTATATASAKSDPKAAQANFQMDGVSGFMRFTLSDLANQSSPIKIDYELHNLKGNNQLYHVHVRPVPPFNAEEIKHKPGAIGDLCNEPATGGHLNPTNIKEKLPAKSAPFEKYEIGDLAGKHGPMVKVAGDSDLYKGSFVDPLLQLSGPNGIVGRSIVIHKSDGGKRWVCASINELKL